MNRKTNKSALTWGQFRFSVIGGLLAKPPSKGELQIEIEKLTAKKYRHPTENRWVSFGFSTIERWYYKALEADNPVQALERKVRSDLGKNLAMPPKLLNELHQQYIVYPHWSYKLHSDNLTALSELKPEFGEAPSYSTVVRRMQERGWDKKKSQKEEQTAGQKKAQLRLEQFEVRGFESEYVNALWHLDFHHGRRIVDVNGNWHTPVALCILDDRSRLCCHFQWYLNETAEALNHGLNQAFHKRGLPRSLMTDNGSAMIATETQSGLSRLSILHETTLPYSPYQNGKQEVFWDQVEGRLVNMVSRVNPLTLEFLNYASQAWVEMEYNRKVHQELSEPPLERYLKGPNVSRESPNNDVLRYAFTVEENRTVRKSDGTISIKGKRFEIPSRFRHFQKVTIRYQTWDLSMAYMVDKRTGTQLSRIYPQDKIKNSNGRRRSLGPVSQTKQADHSKRDPIPPLLRKLMADYAATGLPPAYIPKEEKNLKGENNE
ncbi:MAG: transposase family protein [Bacteroidetes bacterium]|nr:transposase family protein [Bacteroidota bacterium]